MCPISVASITDTQNRHHLMFFNKKYSINAEDNQIKKGQIRKHTQRLTIEEAAFLVGRSILSHFDDVSAVGGSGTSAEDDTNGGKINLKVWRNVKYEKPLFCRFLCL